MNEGDRRASVSSFSYQHHGGGGWFDETSRSSIRNDATPSECEPTSTQLTDFLTQTADLTQLGHDDDEEPVNDSRLNSTSPLVSNSPQPWGRLMLCGGTTVGQTSSIIPLLPRPPRQTTNSLPFHKCDNVSVGDIFNEYTIGRSRTRCDICVQPERESAVSLTPRKKKRQANLDWCYSLISNQHCKIYCTLDEAVWHGRSSLQNAPDPAMSVPTNGTAAHHAAWHVWIEDCSGNGTVINGSILLRKGDKRLLHAGDEICLVYPPTLQRKIASAQISVLVPQFSYVFVNQCAATMPPPRSVLAHAHCKGDARLPRTPSLLSKVTQRAHRGTSSRSAAVDARAATRRRDTTSPSPPSQCHDGSSQSDSRGGRRISPRRQPPRQIQHDYDVRDVLGRGTMGEVRRAIHRQTGQQFAVKILSLVRQRGPWNQTTEIEREAAILRQLQHPYVVKLYDVYTCPEAIYLVMELVAGGDLFDRIVDRGSYSETNARRVMRRLLAAVYYLHEGSGLHIVHRDLKPENVLCVSTTSDIDIKLTDFGLAKPDGDLKTFCGTPQYFAPEVLRRRHTVKGSGRYGKQADMWSLGVILYVLLTGMPPFDEDGASPPQVVDFPDTVPESARDLVRQLLQHDPRQRATVGTACTHAWILTPDGDTHVHPLDDPRIPSTTGTSPRPNDRPNDSTESVDDTALQTCALHRVPRVSSDMQNDLETTTKRDAERKNSSSGFNDSGEGVKHRVSGLDDAKENSSIMSTSPVNVGEATTLQSVRSVEVSEETSVDVTLLKSSNRPSAVRLSATNFSFRPPSAMPMKFETKDSAKPLVIRVLEPSTPLQRDNEETKVSQVSNATPQTAMFEPSRLQNSTGRNNAQKSDLVSNGGLTLAKTLRTVNTNAITPSMSSLRRSESMYDADLDADIDETSTTVQRDGEILDDEVQSVFTDNTESVSSFSTLPADTDDTLNREEQVEAETVATNVTSDRKRKHNTITKSKTKPKPIKTKATPSTKKITGGKQTTLNNWFKK